MTYPNALGGENNPVRVVIQGDSASFAMVNAALAAADAPVDINGQNLTGVDDLAVGGDAAITGALAVTGATTLDDAIVGGDLVVTGAATLNGDIKAAVGDAGAAGVAGEVNKLAGTFTVASGSATYTLTNSFISATSLLFATCVSGAVAQSVYSFVPGAGSAVLTLSGNAGANAKYAFLCINPGA